ncbi:MAG: transglutaminase family protein [Minwuia sp.]|nr:transglutaminase family protein [Minwuia sp.]
MTEEVLYRIRHRTAYRYGSQVLVSQNLLHLTPRETLNQRCLESNILILPSPAVAPSTRVDIFGNIVQNFDLDVPHKRFEVTSTSRIAVLPPSVPDPEGTPAWDSKPETIPAALDPEHHLLHACSGGVEPQWLATAIRGYASPSFAPGRPLLAAGLDLTQRMFRDFAYAPGATTVKTPLSTVLRTRRGVCQDFARLLIAAFRCMGLPAGYVSGYLVTEPPKGQPRLVGADQSHAWVRLHVPGWGWVDLDPTNGVLAGQGHITVAWGRGFRDVVPVKGVITGGGEHDLKVEVDVIPEAEIAGVAGPATAGTQSDRPDRVA